MFHCNADQPVALLTKREMFAMHAMSGLLANTNLSDGEINVCFLAKKQAEHLLASLAEEPDECRDRLTKQAHELLSALRELLKDPSNAMARVSAREVVLRATLQGVG